MWITFGPKSDSEQEKKEACLFQLPSWSNVRDLSNYFRIPKYIKQLLFQIFLHSQDEVLELD